MIETIVALMMYLGDQMIEHSPKENLGECLEIKRKIERHTTPGGNSYIKCGVVKAKTYIDNHGIKRVEKIIEE